MKKQIDKNNRDVIKFNTTNVRGEVTILSLLEFGTQEKAIEALKGTLEQGGEYYEKDVKTITTLVKDVYKDYEIET